MVLDIQVTSPRRPRGRPRTRIEVGEVARLHLPHLLATGRVVVGRVVQCGLTWDQADGSEVSATIMADMGSDRGRIALRHHGGSSYAVDVVSIVQPFGGRRWWLICPDSGARTSTLYLPAGAARFASRQAHRLGYRTQRLKAEARSG